MKEEHIKFSKVINSAYSILVERWKTLHPSSKFTPFSPPPRSQSVNEVLARIQRSHPKEVLASAQNLKEVLSILPDVSSLPTSPAQRSNGVPQSRQDLAEQAQAHPCRQLSVMKAQSYPPSPPPPPPVQREVEYQIPKDYV